MGAGYLISSHAGDVATIVKLTRVACLVPVVLAISIAFNSRARQTAINLPPLVPFFLIGFLWLLLANSFHFNQREYFQADEPSRQNVQVDFGS